jgi:CheY-specific phosphatase CheX
LDVRYINPFIRSTRQVFVEIVNIPVTIGQAYAKLAQDRIHKLYQVSAMIDITVGSLSSTLQVLTSASSVEPCTQQRR